jgi:hypothetical protein
MPCCCCPPSLRNALARPSSHCTDAAACIRRAKDTSTQLAERLALRADPLLSDGYAVRALLRERLRE